MVSALARGGAEGGGAPRRGARPERARAHEDRGHQADVWCLRGAIATRRAPPECEQAEAPCQQALALAAALGLRPRVAHCHRGRGTLYAATGQREPARTARSTAMALSQAMAMPFWLPQTEAVRAQGEG